MTARDLANRLGIAQSTVSRAFTPGSRISDSLRTRIVALANELGYRPNAIARSLITQRSGIVALVIGDITNPFYPEALEEFSASLQNAGKQLLLFVVPKAGEADDIIPQVLQYQVDGIVIAAARLSSRTSQICAARGVPVVFMNRRVVDPSAWSVCCNNESMGVTLAEYLVTKGYRSFAFVEGDPGTSTTIDRRSGFERGLAAHGLKLARVVNGGYSHEGGYAAASELLRGGKRRVEAIFCANDIMALGALAYVRHVAHRSVPRDVAIVGFDDIRAAAYPEFNLTTVRQPVRQMIDLAVSLLLSGRKPGSEHAALQEIPGQLVVRATA